MDKLINKRVVIKIGSSSLVNKDFSINKQVLVTILSECKKLLDNNVHPILVSSGAIALGMYELGLKKKPSEIAIKQACAAIGQAKLMEHYNTIAEIYGLHLGQILVSHDDFSSRTRMLHLSDTLEAMMDNNIIPVINENDAVSVEEIKVGDNDSLSSFVAPVVHADLLILYSDIEGLYTKNPKVYDDAEFIPYVKEINEDLYKMVGEVTSSVGTGGMYTKLNAAKIATSAGVDMIICDSKHMDELSSIVLGKKIGTFFEKKEVKFNRKDHWMIFLSSTKGSVICDEGLVNALRQKRVSILPKGIKEVEGKFLAGDIIEVKSIEGKLLGKGIANYSSFELNKYKGLKTSDIDEVGRNDKKEAIYANDLVLIKE